MTLKTLTIAAMLCGIDAISTQVHARPPDGVARGGGLHALVQVLL